MINHFALLNTLLGDTRDSSETTITISQDDATKDYELNVHGGKKFFARSLQGVIEAAYNYYHGD
jgi:hypothetical protein